MNYRKLGRSGLLVSEIGLGTMIFGEDSQRSTPENEAIELIHAFIDAGGNHIDTANVYANGRSEEIIGKAIQGKRDGLIIATKVRFSMGDGPNDQGLNRYHIMNSVEDSLKRLQLDHIDLLYMHCWDPVTPIEESLAAFDHLVQSGKVRYIGVSNFSAWQLMKSLGLSDQHGWARFVAAQYQYSLVNRDIEDEFSTLCTGEGVGLTPWGPLGGGFLTGKYQREKRPEDPSEGRIAVMSGTEEAWDRRDTERNWKILNQINKILENYPQATHSQIAIRWLLEQPAVSSVLVGVRTMAQLEDNLGAVDLSLSAEEISDLNAISQLPSRYPYRFIRQYGKR